MAEELAPLVPTLTLSYSSSSSFDLEEDNAVNHGTFWLNNHGIFDRIRDMSFGFNKCTVYTFAFVFLFGCFASLIMIAGFYGPRSMWIGPNSSILVEPNSFWVQSIKVKEINGSSSGLELFGFYNTPPLDVIVNWSESRSLSISPHSFKGWPYYLNNGSSLNISYNVKSEGSSALLVVDKGLHHFAQSSSEEPKFEETALSVNLIQGSGVIELNITEASTYFVAVSNFNMKDVKVELDIDVRALVYNNTKHSDYKCTFSDGICKFSALSLIKNYFVLTSPALRQGASVEGWYIKFTYQPRWIGYVLGAGLFICFVLVTIQIWKLVWKCSNQDYLMSSERRRLLENKDDDGSSVGSSLAGDDDDLEDILDSEGNSTRHRCVICFDAPRDCFFLPCGHCVSCYQCGIKVAEAGGSCPICRRKMKKVKRIFTV